MIEKIKKLLLPSEQRKFRVSDNDMHVFLLQYQDLEVGTLTHREHKWIFEYAEPFKETQNLKPLANFPSIEKRYVSEDLWPFFSSRIPSLSRKRVLNKAKKEGIDEEDTISLLKLFGTNTLTNPFVLTPIERSSERVFSE